MDVVDEVGRKGGKKGASRMSVNGLSTSRVRHTCGSCWFTAKITSGSHRKCRDPPSSSSSRLAYLWHRPFSILRLLRRHDGNVKGWKLSFHEYQGWFRTNHMVHMLQKRYKLKKVTRVIIAKVLNKYCSVEKKPSIWKRWSKSIVTQIELKLEASILSKCDFAVLERNYQIL